MVYIENIDDRKYGIYSIIHFKLGDRRKSGGSIWAKRIYKVDRTQLGGYAFIGWFINDGDILEDNTFVVIVSSDGSWNHPSSRIDFYKVSGGKIKSYKIGSWNTKIEKQKAIEKIEKILEENKRKKIMKSSMKRTVKKDTVTKEEVKTRQKKRTQRSRKLDAAKSAKRVYKKGEYGKWIKRPGSGDISGIDTKKKLKK